MTLHNASAIAADFAAIRQTLAETAQNVRSHQDAYRAQHGSYPHASLQHGLICAERQNAYAIGRLDGFGQGVLAASATPDAMATYVDCLRSASVHGRDSAECLCACAGSTQSDETQPQASDAMQSASEALATLQSVIDAQSAIAESNPWQIAADFLSLICAVREPDAVSARCLESARESVSMAMACAGMAQGYTDAQMTHSAAMARSDTDAWLNTAALEIAARCQASQDAGQMSLADWRPAHSAWPRITSRLAAMASK